MHINISQSDWHLISSADVILEEHGVIIGVIIDEKTILFETTST